MRILVNYDKAEQGFLGILQWHLRNRNIEAIATSSTLGIGELMAKASAIKAQAILCCNAGTLQALVPGEKPTLDDYRGSVLRYEFPVVIANSLAHTQTVDHGSWLLGKDIDKLFTAKQPPVPFEFSVLTDLSSFPAALADLSDSVVIAYDIETKTFGGTSKKEKETGDWSEKMPEAGETLITCVSYSFLRKNGTIGTYVLPFIDFDEDHWQDDLSYQQAILLMRQINKLPTAKAAHNGMYDAIHSICYHAEPYNWIFDTMALQHAEFSSLPKSLDFVASLHLPDYIQWKNEAEAASKHRDIGRYWAYNARDTFSTLRILISQLKTLPPYARKNYALQFPMVYPSLYCNFEGFQVDMAKRNELRLRAAKKQEEALARLQVMVSDSAFNPGSPKQVATIIYDIFGATDPRIGWRKDANKKKTKMERGTDEKNLKAVGEQHPILLRLTDAILQYRESGKAIGTYFDFSLYKGRLLWALNPFGTDTNRMACTSSSLWCGTQVQNIPPYAKEMLVAEDGFTLMEADQSQSDARGTAYLSQDLTLIAALEAVGKDFYKSLGTLFFAIPYEQVTKEFRNAVLKKIVHGTNYMMGAVTFIDNAGVQNILIGAAVLGIKVTMASKPAASEISLKDFAQSLLESYHKPFNRVRPWYVEVKNEVRTTKMLKSPSGHTRYFFGDIDKKYQIFSSAVAHGPQHLTGAVLNKGFWKIWGLQKSNPQDIRMKAQIHDSVLQQIRTEKTDALKKIILTSMDNPIIIHGRSLHIPVDYKLGSNWADMEEFKS